MSLFLASTLVLVFLSFFFFLSVRLDLWGNTPKCMKPSPMAQCSASVCPLLDPKESVIHSGAEDGQELLVSDLK